MEVKISKKGYYLPDDLVDLFKEWSKPGRNYSPKVAGAIFFYMHLSPNLRDICEKAAHSKNIKAAMKAMSAEVEKLNMENLAQAVVLSALAQTKSQPQKKAGKPSKSG